MGGPLLGGDALDSGKVAGLRYSWYGPKKIRRRKRGTHGSGGSEFEFSVAASAEFLFNDVAGVSAVGFSSSISVSASYAATDVLGGSFVEFPFALTANGGLSFAGSVSSVFLSSLTASGSSIDLAITAGPTLSDMTETTVQVSWSLNRTATGQVEYGLTSSYGSTTPAEESFDYSTHIQNIVGLIADTLYHYRVKSTDQGGQTVYSSDATFTTNLDSQYPPETTLSYVEVNSDARPGYLTDPGLTDSTWGTEVRRISDVNQTKPDYPRHQLWNLDGTRMLLFRNGNGWRLHNGTTYADLSQSLNGVEYPVWSNTDADKAYGCSQGQNALKRYSLASPGWVTVATLSAYGHLALGNGEGNLSDNDRAALIYNTASDLSGTWGVVVVNCVTGAVISSLAIGTGSGNHPNNVCMSRSGAYVIVEHGTGGSGNSQGTQVYNAADMSRIRQIVTTRPHADAAKNAAGEDIFVHMEGASGVTSHRLSDGLSIDLFPSGGGVMDGGHVSGAMYELPGWVGLSSNSYSTSAVGANQVVLAKTDGSGTVRVFGCTHAENSTTHQQYDYAPHATWNRDGSLCAFGSVWHASSIDTMLAYVAGMVV